MEIDCGFQVVDFGNLVVDSDGFRWIPVDCGFQADRVQARPRFRNFVPNALHMPQERRFGSTHRYRPVGRLARSLQNVSPQLVYRTKAIYNCVE